MDQTTRNGERELDKYSFLGWLYDACQLAKSGAFEKLNTDSGAANQVATIGRQLKSIAQQVPGPDKIEPFAERMRRRFGLGSSLAAWKSRAVSRMSVRLRGDKRLSRRNSAFEWPSRSMPRWPNSKMRSGDC